jgi:hypothetical protein
MISDTYELHRFLATPRIEVTNMLLDSDDVCAAWRYRDDEIVPNLRHKNDVIDGCVTARVRLRLYT